MDITRREALELLGFGTTGIAIQPWVSGIAERDGELWSPSATTAGTPNPEVTAILFLYGRVDMPSPESDAIRSKSREELVAMLDRECENLKRDWLRRWDTRIAEKGIVEINDVAETDYHQVMVLEPQGFKPEVTEVGEGEYRFSAEWVPGGSRYGHTLRDAASQAAKLTLENLT